MIDDWWLMIDGWWLMVDVDDACDESKKNEEKVSIYESTIDKKAKEITIVEEEECLWKVVFRQ